MFAVKGGFDFSSFEMYYIIQSLLNRTYVKFKTIGEILIKKRGYILNK